MQGETEAEPWADGQQTPVSERGRGPACLGSSERGRSDCLAWATTNVRSDSPYLVSINVLITTVSKLRGSLAPGFITSLKIIQLNYC